MTTTAIVLSRLGCCHLVQTGTKRQTGVGLNTTFIKCTFFFLVASSVLARLSLAAEVLDQSATGNDGPTAVGSPTERAQTFTAGITGQLTRVELNFGSVPGVPIKQGPLIVGIHDLDSNGKPGTNLGATNLDVSDFTDPFAPGNFTSFDLLDENIDVQAGVQYAIVINLASNEPGIQINLGVLSGNPYSGGLSMSGVIGTPNWSSFPNEDYSFKTFVLPVPEPSAMLLAIASALMPPRRVRLRSDQRGVVRVVKDPCCQV